MTKIELIRNQLKSLGFFLPSTRSTDPLFFVGQSASTRYANNRERLSNSISLFFFSFFSSMIWRSLHCRPTMYSYSTPLHTIDQFNVVIEFACVEKLTIKKGIHKCDANERDNAHETMKLKYWPFNYHVY